MRQWGKKNLKKKKKGPPDKQGEAVQWVTYCKQLPVGWVGFGVGYKRQGVEGKKLCCLTQGRASGLDEFLEVCHGCLSLTLQMKQEEKASE